MTDQNYKLNLFRTFLVYIAFTGIGSGMTVLGSCLLDLQIQVGVSFEAVSHVIPIRAAGLIVGYFFAGLIGERMNPQVLMFLTNIFTGVTFLSAPWNHHLTGLMIDFFLSGVFLAANKVCCNQFIFSMWGEKNALYLQFLYMCYDIGSFMAPFFTKPFLLPESARNTSLILGNSSTEVTFTEYKPSDVKIQYPIMIVGAFFIASALGFLILHYTRPYVKPLPKNTIKSAPSIVKHFDEKTWLKWLIIVLMCFFTHFAQSTTDLVGEMGPSFAVMSDLKMDKQAGVTLVSVFWGFFTSYRLIFIIFLMFTTAEKAKMFNVILLFVALIILVPHGESEPVCLWVGMIFLGLGLCPLFAATYGSLQKLFPVTSYMTAAFFISTCIGRLVYPWLVSQYLASYPAIFLYVIAFSTTATGILTTVIPVVGEKYLKYATIKHQEQDKERRGNNIEIKSVR